jgi:hypothetical protein
MYAAYQAIEVLFAAFAVAFNEWDVVSEGTQVRIFQRCVYEGLCVIVRSVADIGHNLLQKRPAGAGL